MKGSAFLLIALFVLAISASACKTHERCPAYGQIDQSEAADQV